MNFVFMPRIRKIADFRPKFTADELTAVHAALDYFLVPDEQKRIDPFLYNVVRKVYYQVHEILERSPLLPFADWNKGTFVGTDQVQDREVRIPRNPLMPNQNV